MDDSRPCVLMHTVIDVEFLSGLAVSSSSTLFNEPSDLKMFSSISRHDGSLALQQSVKWTHSLVEPFKDSNKRLTEKNTFRT